MIICSAGTSIAVHHTGYGEKIDLTTEEVVAEVLISTETSDTNGEEEVLAQTLAGR